MQGINVKKMILFGIAGIFIGLILGLVVMGVLGGVFKLSNGISWTGYWIFVVLIIFLFGRWGAKAKTKEDIQAELQNYIVSEEGLTRNEKIAAWIFSIINPIITGGIMYYMWNKKYPTKAKKANNISMIVFLVELILGTVLAISSK